ncbi:TetR/AcrR family transcriptional regulator [Streptomyces rugosispiralis]|uniref:TetR/AcrR family transcriptional regulator n=1 Tax=Streptomyces rugosispiralis TaxID=2967341 RepID=A0ABT1VAI9_9ACTN|nr:TetR/AcrR family transcriptional regulator [Streptomyces rugosispiralis]MCQ8194287.1 TetR/AcrR family transcriptional regulator [Streptomyces rugosispiralis]
MTSPKALRRDARDNIAKLRAAALEVFSAKGLNAPLDEIAQIAGVSIGTLYNRFGSREALINAVLPDVAGHRLQSLRSDVEAQPTARGRLEAFVRGMIALQQDDPALNDAILRRFPDATAVQGVCEVSTALGRQLVRDAHQEGSLAPDFTEDDLLRLLWLAGTASREPSRPAGWQRILDRALASAWLDCAEQPSVAPQPRNGTAEPTA